MKYIVGIIGIIAIAGLYLPTFDGLGAITFPTTLDTLTNPSPTDRTATVSHSGQHSDANDAIEALEAKVGADGSAVTSSHDYKLSGVTGSDLACSLTGTETLTNKTLTSPLFTSLYGTTSDLYGTTTINNELLVIGSTTINTTGEAFTLTLGSDATGDVYYRNSSGNFTRLGVGSNGDFLTLSSGIPAWVANTPSAPAISRSATTTSSTTIQVTADGASTFVVTAYGSGEGSGAGGDKIVTLTLNGNAADTYTFANPGAGSDAPYVLYWTGVLSAGDHDFALSANTGSVDFNRYIVQDF